jgi:hypothetical protein
MLLRHTGCRGRQRFLVILAVTGFAYLLGLSNYGVAEEGTADDTDIGHQARSPASP